MSCICLLSFAKSRTQSLGWLQDLQLVNGHLSKYGASSSPPKYGDLTGSGVLIVTQP